MCVTEMTESVSQHYPINVTCVWLQVTLFNQGHVYSLALNFDQNYSLYYSYVPIPYLIRLRKFEYLACILTLDF